MDETLVIDVDDPRAADVVVLLERHLAFARDTSPPEHVHALDIEGLLDLSVTFVSARRDRVLMAVGALKELDSTHGELKSIHTAHEARRQGVGRALVLDLVGRARDRGYTRVSLETGSMEAFGASRALYESLGFVYCEPFAQYTNNEYSTCMTLQL